jgi:hypothetical protein
MKRRTVLGLAATAVVGCGPKADEQAKAPTGPTGPTGPGMYTRKKMKKPATPSVYNYDWGSSEAEKQNMYRAQMLALTMLIINGTKTGPIAADPANGAGHFNLIRRWEKQSDLPGDHPMKDVEKQIYDQTRAFVLKNPQSANDKLYAAATTLMEFANYGLDGLVHNKLAKLDKDGKAAPYTNPDECPCENDPQYYDCPPVDPLL